MADSQGLCQQCQQLTLCTDWRSLTLCRACATMRGSAVSACGDFQHAFLGGKGLWICLTCGTGLGHTAINTDPVAKA